MKKIYLITLLLSVLFSICFSIGFSQEYKTTETEYSGTKAFIKFHNKDIYYLNRPVWVEFQIVNEDIHPHLFLAAYKKLFTFDFEVYSRTNRPVEHSTEWVIDRHRFEAVLSDEITLKENEVYGVRIDISRWFDFPAPGEYIVRGVFYPGLITNPERKYHSENELLLTLHPPYTEEVMQKERMEEIKKLKAQSLPPYEVVDVLLKSLMDGDFEKYFLYLRFDRFIRQFENAYRKYRDAHDTDKPPVVEEFKSYLKGDNKLEAIPYSDAVPVSYEIEETYIKGRDSTVTVRETFRYLALVEEKRYTYHLHLYGDKWLVEKYDVVNISK
ncbi:MAG: hypothetical protein JXQ30_03155 [Spirochaetes bacterium]|nr:hypothetical protein [Spirochaetota bacterium]